MIEWFQQLLIGAQGEPLVQGALAAFSTFILEDPTTVGCGFLVADGKMAFNVAYIGLSAGIAIGDFGLYALGRYMGPWVRTSRFVPASSLARAERWFSRNLVWAVVLSRFVPGMRLPTYTAAGLLRANPWAFLGTTIGASLVWTYLLLSLAVQLGDALLPRLGPLKWGIVAGLVAMIGIIQWLLGKRAAKASALEPDEPQVASFFEFWPPWLFYIPVVGYYFWLGLRHWGLTLPTASNPKIYSGGLIRESKSQILGLTGPTARAWVAPWAYWERPASGTSSELLAQALSIIRAAGLSLPLVAKPDMGQRGAGVRPVRTEGELGEYLDEFPAGAGLIFQKLVDCPHEAGVLFARLPEESKGRILSITLKEFPSVTGDGTRTLRELIMDDPRARLISEVYLARHHGQLERVLSAGENFPLVFAGNHCQGAIFLDGTHLVTEALLARIEEIAGDTEELYFARFDMRFRDLDTFLKGEDFKIIEINGAGAEATHIWDARMTLREAYRVLFEQWRILFAIGAQNRRRGAKPLGAWSILTDFRSYLKTSEKYPSTH